MVDKIDITKAWKPYESNQGYKAKSYYIEGERTPWGSAISSRPLSFARIKNIAKKAEVITAILLAEQKDVLRVDYELLPIVSKPKPSQLKKAKNFLTHPNPESVGFEWAETTVYDYALLFNAFVEMVGSEDYIVKGKAKGKDIVDVKQFGGELKAIYEIDASTIELVRDKDGNLFPEPPAPSYVQKINGKITGYFSRDKIYRITQNKQGMEEGFPSFVSILDVLLSYELTKDKYASIVSGEIPRTIVNVGTIPGTELDRLQESIRQQLKDNKNNCGLIMINGVEMKLERIMETPSEGQFLEMLRYNRETIAMVFGCPPMKLGIVETGKLANPDEQLDTWYDGIEMVHKKLQDFINYTVFRLLGVTDYEIRFISPRPKQLDKVGKAFFQMTQGIAVMRDRGQFSVNVGNGILNDYILDRKKRIPIIDEDWADDPRWIAPERKAWTQAQFGKDDELPKPEGGEPSEESLPELDFFEKTKFSNFEWKKEDKDYVDGIDALKDEYTDKFEDKWTLVNKRIGKRIKHIVEEALPSEKILTKQTEAEINAMMNLISAEVAMAMGDGFDETSMLYESCYKDTQSFVGDTFGVRIAFGPEDLSAVENLQNKWRDKTTINTVGAYDTQIRDIINQNINESHEVIARKIEEFASLNGINNPKYIYKRIALTETSAVVEQAHLNSDKKVGFVSWRYLVAAAPCEDCEVYADRLFSYNEAIGLLPVHCHCQCTLVPEGIRDMLIVHGEVED